MGASDRTMVASDWLWLCCPSVPWGVSAGCRLASTFRVGRRGSHSLTSVGYVAWLSAAQNGGGPLWLTLVDWMGRGFFRSRVENFVGLCSLLPDLGRAVKGEA